MRCLVDCPGKLDHKLLLLDEGIPAGQLNGLPDSIQKRIQASQLRVCTHEVQICYGDMSSEAILRVRLGAGQNDNCLASYGFNSS
jgi:hypothetical protein